MTCNTSFGKYNPDEKKYIKNVYLFVADKENPVYAKINKIDELQKDLGNKTLFVELKNLFILQNEKFIKDRIVELNAEEKNFANMIEYGTKTNDKQAKPITKAFMLDGTKYIAVHSEGSVRVVDSETMKDIGIFSTYTDDIKQRNIDIIEQTSDALIENFDEEFSTLGAEIVQDLRIDNPIKNKTDIPIERQIIRENKNSGLFANIKNAISRLNPLLNGTEKSEPDTQKYVDSIEEITAFIPTNVREMILGDKSPTESKMFMDNMQHFLNVFDSLDVPIEEVWKKNFELNNNGDIVQIQGSKYISPNYLQFLGSFKTVKNNKIKDKNIDSKYKQTDQLVLNDAVGEIVKFYSIKAMADMKEMIENINGKEISDIARVLNVDTMIAYKLKNEFIEHNTIPVSSFISDAAKDAYNQLGITVSSGVNMEIKDGIIASLKALISATLVESEYITHDTFESEKETILAIAEAEKKSKDNKKSNTEIDSEANIKIQSIANKYDFDGKHFAMYTLNEEAFKSEGKKINGMNESFYIINKLKYLNVNEKRKVPTLKPTPKAPKTILNSSYNANPDLTEFIEKQNSVPWRYKEDFAEIYDAWQKTLPNDKDTKEEAKIKEEARELILISLGKEVVDTNKQHVSELKVIMSNNDKIERELEVLMSMYPTLNGKDFYLDWVETASGRATISSDMHPQESKLIRSLIEQPTQKGKKPGHNVPLEFKDFNKDSKKVQMLEGALAQAFDMDPDKNSKPTILKAIREVVDITGSDVAINTNTDFGKALELVVTGSGTPKETANAMNLIFNEGEGHHALQAARMLKRLRTWKKSDQSKPFNNDLTIETDAITSGMILTLMQIVDNTAIDFLAKGGIYTENTLNKWSEYTKKWLKLSYDMNDMDSTNIEFGPAGLIEAGNFHQKLLDGGEAELAKIRTHYKTLASEKEKKFVTNMVNEIETTEVFQDLYKTIGIEMQDAVNEKKIDIKNQLSRINNTVATKLGLQISLGKQGKKLKKADKQILSSAQKLNDRLKLQDSMLDKIGEITPKKLRAIAKDPVMTYIYGSMIKSIRKNLGGSVGVAHFVDSIKIKHELESRIDNGEKFEKGSKEDKALKIANRFIDATLDAVERRTSFGRKYPFDVRKSLKYKELNNEDKIVSKSYFKDEQTPLHKVLMNLEINDDIVGVLTKAVNDTFGDAIADAFEAKTGSVDTYRNMMKSTELFSFELFRSKTEIYKKALMDKYDGVIPDFEFRDMLKSMEEAGIGADVPTGNYKTTDRRLPILNMETGPESKGASVTIRFNKDDLLDKNGKLLDAKTNKQTRAYARLTGRDFVSNTGAVATTSIHQMDSRGITVTVSGESWLSIYDAVVQASDPDNVEYVTGKYNTTIFDQNSERDILGDNIRKMTGIFSDLVDAYKAGDKDAKKQILDIKRRMKSTEKVTYRLYTYTEHGQKKKIIIPKLVDVDRTKATGTFIIGKENTEREAYYVDILEKQYSAGTSIIKEVYWTPKNGKRVIKRTIVKTIKEDTMHVVVMEKYDITSIDPERKERYTGYKFEYTVNGKEEIKKHNKIRQLNKVNNEPFEHYKKQGLKFTEENLFKNSDQLIDIINTDTDIDSSSRENKNNPYTPVALKGEMYTNTLAGSDFKSEALRLSLPIMAIIDNFNEAKAFMQTRFDNLNGIKWYSAHSNVFDTIPSPVGIGKGKMGKVETEQVVQMLKTIQKENVASNYKYVQQNIDVIDSQISKNKYSPLFVETHNLVKAGLNEAMKAKSDVYTTGSDPRIGYGETFNKVGLHNTNYYKRESILTVLPAQAGGLSVEYGNKLGYGFDGLEQAMKVGATIITQQSDPQIESDMKIHNLLNETDVDAIMIIRRKLEREGNRYDIETNYELERQISSYQINAYMRSKNYTVKVENGYNVWTTEMSEIEVDGKKKTLPQYLVEKEAKKQLKKVCN